MGEPTASDPFAGLPVDVHGVLRRDPEDEQFRYADGAESHLLDLMSVVEDRSSSSGELPALATDWATTYHLSPARWTLLDALDLPPGRVLELGAGCGALTTWLAEHHDAVDAVEGSAARAAVIRARCEGLDNVRVISGDISAFAPVPRYDVVTLIGVLEYARCFGATEGLPAREASRALLRTAQSWLAPGGVLLVAIENQFGLKYLAGHVEDHTGGAYDGLHGYQRPGTAVTFTRTELQEDLAAAGLEIDDLVLPFPDYKLPETLINAGRLRPGVAWWVSTPWAERGTDRTPAAFNEILALTEAERGGLLAELSNSFLVLARATGQARGPSLDWSVRHYTVGRQPALRKRKTLTERDGAPAVLVESLARGATPSPGFVGIDYEQHLEDERPAEGRPLAARLLHGEPAGARDRIAGLLAEHARWLVRTFGDDNATPDDAPLDSDLTLQPAAYDAHPLNIIVGPDGAWHPIDLEWRPRRTVTLAEATWRAAHVLLLRWRHYVLPEDAHDGRSMPEVAATLAAQALGTVPERLPWRSAAIREERFQDAVRGVHRGSSGPAARLAARNAELLEQLMDRASEVDAAVRRAAEAEHAAAVAHTRHEQQLAALARELQDVEQSNAAAQEQLRHEAEAARADAAAIRTSYDELRHTRVVRLASSWWRLRSR